MQGILDSFGLSGEVSRAESGADLPEVGKQSTLDLVSVGQGSDDESV